MHRARRLHFRTTHIPAAKVSRPPSVLRVPLDSAYLSCPPSGFPHQKFSKRSGAVRRMHREGRRSSIPWEGKRSAFLHSRPLSPLMNLLGSRSTTLTRVIRAMSCTRDRNTTHRVSGYILVRFELWGQDDGARSLSPDILGVCDNYCNLDFLPYICIYLFIYLLSTYLTSIFRNWILLIITILLSTDRNRIYFLECRIQRTAFISLKLVKMIIVKYKFFHI